jgi:hypothetical protein
MTRYRTRSNSPDSELAAVKPIAATGNTCRRRFAVGNLDGVQTTDASVSTGTEAAMVRQLSRPALVIVRRDAGRWLAEIAALGTVQKARTLVALDRRIRDLLGTNAIDYAFRTGNAELDRLITQIRATRAAVRQGEERIRHLARQALLIPSGGSGRDVAFLLGMSYQRVYQLMQRTRLSTVEGNDEREH